MSACVASGPPTRSADPSLSRAVRPAATATPSAATLFVYGDGAGIDPRDRADIVIGLQAGEQYLARHLGGIRGPIRIDAVAVPDASGPCCRSRGGDGITFNTLSREWTDPPNELDGPTNRAKVTAHELVHLWQSQQGCFNDRLPFWITEGMAELVGFRAVIAAGLLDPSYETIALPARVRGNPRRFALRTAESVIPPGPFDAYAVFQLAMVRATSAAGPDSPGRFCDLVRSGTGWPSAFAAAFGVSPDAFYDDFDAYLRSGQ